MRRLLVTVLVTVVIVPVVGVLEAPAAHAGTTRVTTAPSSVTTNPAFTRESFEGSKAADGDIVTCTTVSSDTSNACYEEDVIASGMAYRHSGNLPGSIAVVGEGFGGAPTTSTTLLLNASGGLVVEPTRRTDTVAFRLWNLQDAGTCTITVAYVDGTAPTTFSRSCPVLAASPPSPGAYVGLEADRSIASITITGANPTIDNVVFGTRPSNRIAVGSPRLQRSAGTATLPVRVPGVGITTVTGRQIVTGSDDSARPRTLALTVVAKGAARRTLLRTGRVTVTVKVTYRPNGGRAASKTKQVTLVQRR